MPSKTKWFNWFLNPAKTLVDVINGNPSPDKWYESLPFVGDIASQFDSDYQSDRLKSSIENIAEKSGMSLEEFLALNPDYKKVYDNPSDYIGLNGDAKTVQEGAQSFLGLDLSELMPALINKLLGVTDVQENTKNRNFQSHEAEIARNWEAEQAKAAREWDSIGAQMERAAAAGVNPISIAMQNGGINASATTSIPSSPGVPSGSAGLMSNSPLDLASTIFQGIGTLAENRLKQSQADDIVIMRQFNIAEKQANTAHLQQLCQSVGLSNIAQGIQNRWLDTFNKMNYIQMQLDQGVSRATIFEKYSISQLNAAQIADVRQNMRLNLERFNATLPLEVQLMEAELDLTHKTAQDVYEEICLRHLQQIEQKNRNQQSAAEAQSAETAAGLAKATYEDAISAFHNDMVKGAAEAGITLNDYNYYGIISHSPTEALGKSALQFRELNHKRKNLVRRIFGARQIPYYDINGYSGTKLQGLQ